MPSTIPIYPLRLAPEVRDRAEARAKQMGIPLSAYIVLAVKGLNDAVLRVERPGLKSKMLKPPAAVQARNAQCACGSGLKFKRCCGR